MSTEMHIETITVGPYQSNCYIVWNDDKQALVIDPGDEAQRIMDAIEERNLTVIAYPTTHGHIDHVNALAEVHRAHPAPIGLHKDDAQWAFEPINALPPYTSSPERPEKIERALDEGQTWDDGSLHYEVLFTPGHTPGHVSFYFPAEGILFPGDVLFRGSVGRTDLPGGDARTLTRSLARVAELPDDTVVYPGHGPETTIGIEKQTNFFLQNLPKGS